MSEVKLRKGQSIEVGIQRLRKLLDREGTLKKAREKRFYEKPSRKKYRQQRKAKYIQRLRSKDEQW
ncbi:30S ribosomal protein S21 [bacterium]|nr:30S ribosomal protein S21 [bacterium]